MQIPLKQANTSNLDPVERTEKMLDLIRNHDQRGVGDVLKMIGEAEEIRGRRMKEYVDAAKEFYKEMGQS